MTPHPKRIGRITVRAHPEQPIGGHGTLLFGGHEWEWGPEWRLGHRGGRWAIAVDSVSSYAVRVEWDASERVIGAFEMGSKVSSAVFARHETELSDVRDGLLVELAGFDALAADLWARRDP